MQLPKFLPLIYSILLFSPLYSQQAGNTAPQKPNIVFIFADDLGYKDLGCYGNPFNQTPHLDTLAQQGMKFTQAYVASPVCSPSRAALLTGKHPARLHLTNFLVGLREDSASTVLPAPYQHYLSANEITLPEMLKEKGYYSGIVGKWHLGGADSVSPTAQGFDYDRIISRNGLDYYNYSISSGNKEIFADQGTEYLTDKLTEYGLEFLDQHQQKPFFLYMAYSAPHVFIVPRADKLKKYFLKYNQYDGRYNPYYAAMIESLDEGVGKLREKIKALGLEQNTIFIFTSDNGGVGLDELGPVPTSIEPLRAWKGHVYEGGIRVPLIISWPGKIEENVVNENYLTGTDYFPTFMELLGIKDLPAPMDGKSFLSTLYHPEEKLDRGPIYWHYPHFSNQLGRPAGAIRWGDFKLVESYETGTTALYNLAADISESKDLSSELPEKAEEMHTMLKNWRQEVNANMPLPNPAYFDLERKY